VATTTTNNKVRRVLFFVIFILSSGLLWAQYPSDGGNFTVNERKGCAPFTITINPGVLCAGACNIIYENNLQEFNVFTHTFTQPGTYQVRVFFPNFNDAITIVVDPNIVPDVELYSCSGRRVRVNVTDKNYDSYFINFGDGNNTSIPSGNNQTVEHTYSVAGNYPIQVRGRDVNSAFNCTPNIKTFAAVATLPAGAISSLVTSDASSIQLTIAPQANVLHRLEIATNGTTSFQIVQNIYQTTTATVTGLNTDQNFYCFRLGSLDPCTNTLTYSPVVCSHRVNLSIQNARNVLSWTIPNTGIQTNATQIERVSENITQNIPAGAGTPTSFTDVDVTCQINYCYRVITNYTHGSRRTSLQCCGEAVSTVNPAAITNTSAVVSATGVELNWIQNPAFTVDFYSILRGPVNTVLVPFAQSAVPSLEDATYTTEGNLCYRVNYTDKCANVSGIGSVICPIRLSAIRSFNNEVTLRWNSYKGCLNNVRHYLIEKTDAAGNIIGTINNARDTVFMDDEEDEINQIITYRIRAIAIQNGIAPSLSNMVTIRKEPRLFSPTAFTPNNDNLNDTFALFGKFIEKMELQIYDRWGNVVFATESNEPWDGTTQGKPLPESAYVWKASITDKTGETVTRTGTVALLRKIKK
jgi:gliding motility-associated-like protein